MNLILPREIKFDEVTTEMRGDLVELARQVNEIRPLSPEVLHQVKEQLLGERVFSSNAIEGNTLTIRETRLILQTKTYLDVKRKREAREALNLGEAASRVEQHLGVKEAAGDISLFLDIHETLMGGVNDGIAGKIRNVDVMITGAKHQPPGSREASDLLDKIFAVLAEEEQFDGLTLSTWTHWAIARVHPFEDGNGRMARLWQDFLLLRSRLTVAIIRPQDGQVYYDALGMADDGDFNPLFQLICQRIHGTFQEYLNAQEAADLLRGWASNLVGEASAREAERKKLAYLRWRHAVERFRDAFERCAIVINRGADTTLEVQIQQYDIIDQQTWESLLAGGGAKKTWFFKALFRKNQEIIWYYFFFGTHYWEQADEMIGADGPWVNIMISQQRPGEEYATRLEYLDRTPINLREILVVEKQVVCRRRDPFTLKDIYSKDESPIAIAKEFFESIILRQLA